MYSYIPGKQLLKIGNDVEKEVFKILFFPDAASKSNYTNSIPHRVVNEREDFILNA